MVGNGKGTQRTLPAEQSLGAARADPFGGTLRTQAGDGGCPSRPDRTGNQPDTAAGTAGGKRGCGDASAAAGEGKSLKGQRCGSARDRDTERWVGKGASFGGERNWSGNAANLMTGSRMQQACRPDADAAKELRKLKAARARPGKEGTKHGRATRSQRWRCGAAVGDGCWGRNGVEATRHTPKTMWEQASLERSRLETVGGQPAWVQERRSLESAQAAESATTQAQREQRHRTARTDGDIGGEAEKPSEEEQARADDRTHSQASEGQVLGPGERWLPAQETWKSLQRRRPRTEGRSIFGCTADCERDLEGPTESTRIKPRR